MEASFLSKPGKQLKGFIALGFLLASLLGAHWIGFAHGISHSGIHNQNQNIELSCVDQAPTLSHSPAGCHLLDALTLADFIASTPNPVIATNLSHEVQLAPSDSSPALTRIGPYQSRAPPNFVL